ncbi:hypothetical protein Mapa_014412 [Marchantia paleacea]|nr:hypothetical protein Mapa_014412 [Marchantia paleacea]
MLYFSLAACRRSGRPGTRVCGPALAALHCPSPPLPCCPLRLFPTLGPLHPLDPVEGLRLSLRCDSPFPPSGVQAVLSFSACPALSCIRDRSFRVRAWGEAGRAELRNPTARRNFVGRIGPYVGSRRAPCPEVARAQACEDALRAGRLLIACRDCRRWGAR